jgi:hypothetical protein
MRRRAVAALLLALGCSKKTEQPSDASVAAAAPAASAAPSVDIAWPIMPVEGYDPPASGEALRSKASVASLKASLDARSKAVVAHFGEGDLDIQTSSLASEHRSVTLYALSGKPTGEAKPFVVVADDKHVLWSKERPVAGIMAPVGPIAIAAGPHDRVAIAACDPPTGVVALRLWDIDGAPFADFQAMSNEPECDAIALMFWPKHGWILVIAKNGATRAQLVKENGGLGWGNALDVGVRSRPNALAPPSLAPDTGDTFVLAQIAQPTAEPGSPFHALLFRYDEQGTPVWPQAVDVPLEKAGPNQRARLTSAKPGVTFELGNKTIKVMPSGQTRPD